jgi:putative ABC transport system permease protein
VSSSQADASRSTALSRAYRLNLDMLALVALFTGAFLVFTTQFLALTRRRTQLALLRVLGITQPVLRRFLLLEAALLGLVASALGLYAGYELAAYIVRHVGADLGAGYFRSVTPVFTAQPGALAAYFVLGVAFSVIGAAPPSFEIARRAPALALKAGDQQDARANPRTGCWGIGFMIAGAALAAMPDVAGIPVAGYAAIGLLLLGTIAVMPVAAEWLLDRVPAPRRLLPALALAQLKSGPRQAAISVSAIVASFTPMVSMLIMVTSFRASLDAWLTHMLPADLYLRAAPTGETGFFTPEQQDRIRDTEGVARVTFIRSRTLLLDAYHPPVTLLARPIEAQNAAAVLPLRTDGIVPHGSLPPPVWISEPLHDAFGWEVGDEIELPLASRSVRFTVAGIWRDYARQNGCVVMDHELYARLTGDRLTNDAAIWLAPGSGAERVSRALREGLDAAEALEIAPTAAIRARSLAAFDRTFAVTYGLEAAAVLIGLFGVSSAFSAQVLARRREFGVLRHLGMTRRRIAAMLACEGGFIAAFGAAVGLVLGWGIGLVLIRVINRQSFHWSMDLHLPLAQLAMLTAVLVATAAGTAACAGRYAMSNEAARAVREDW